MIVEEWKSTEPFYLEGHGRGREVCLMLIHGFTGNPGDCRRLGLALNQAGYSVYAICLPGHGRTPEEMNETRWEDWWQHTVNCYDAIMTSDRVRTVIPVGFSMGGLLALNLSLVREVPGVVSLAAPVFLQDRRVWLARYVRHLKPYIHKQPAISEYLALERCAYSKTPLACVASLYKHIRRMKRLLPEVRVPLFVGQGLADGTVRPESAWYIFDTVGSVKKVLRVYPDSTHALLADKCREEVFRDVRAFADHLMEEKIQYEQWGECYRYRTTSVGIYAGNGLQADDLSGAGEALSDRGSGTV